MKNGIKISMLIFIPLLTGCRSFRHWIQGNRNEDSTTWLASPSNEQGFTWQATPVSLRDFLIDSSGAAAQCGLSPEFVAALPSLHRLRSLDRCVVNFEHYVYRAFSWGADEIYKREGTMIILGTEGDTIVGLTTRCAIDFLHPGPQYLSGGGPNTKPDFVAGVIALSPPSAQQSALSNSHKFQKAQRVLPNGSPGESRDYYFVTHETNENSPVFSQPYGRFTSEFLTPLSLDNSAWRNLLTVRDVVSFQPIENNDLALVVFENGSRKFLGVRSVQTQTKDGLYVSYVYPKSSADNAGIRSGDILKTFNGKALLDVPDLDPAKAAAPVNRVFPVRILRGGEMITVHVIFQYTGNFFTRGDLEPLGVRQPLEAVSRLLAALSEVGDLLGTRFSAHCQLCDERIKRAEIKSPPTLVEKVLHLLPIAGSLLATNTALSLLGTETAINLRRATETVHAAGQFATSFVALHNDLKSVVQQAEDLETFTKEFSLGEPIVMKPADINVIRGDTLGWRKPGGEPKRIHLAYCTSVEPDGGNMLKGIVEMARREDCVLVAVPDGRDIQGGQHCHILVVNLSEGGHVDTFQPTALFEGYVNLVLVRRGVAHATDFNVSDGRSTRIILDALRRLDALK